MEASVISSNKWRENNCLEKKNVEANGCFPKPTAVEDRKLRHYRRFKRFRSFQVVLGGCRWFHDIQAHHCVVLVVDGICCLHIGYLEFVFKTKKNKN